MPRIANHGGIRHVSVLGCKELDDRCDERLSHGLEAGCGGGGGTRGIGGCEVDDVVLGVLNVHLCPLKMGSNEERFQRRCHHGQLQPPPVLARRVLRLREALHERLGIHQSDRRIFIPAKGVSGLFRGRKEPGTRASARRRRQAPRLRVKLDQPVEYRGVGNARLLHEDRSELRGGERRGFS